MGSRHTIQLATAYPDAKLVGGRKSKTLFGLIETDKGQGLAYFKLLPIDGIAKEALCAVLAKVVGLPVKEPCYVDVSNIGHSSANTAKVAFGTIHDKTPVAELDDTLRKKLGQWPDLLPSAVFDLWIANEDRLPKNILFEKIGLYWLIDHDDAFPSHIEPHQPTRAQLLEIAAHGKLEIDLHRIRRQAMDIIRQYEQINWDKISDIVDPDQIQGSSMYFERYIRFLQERLQSMEGMLNGCLEIKQKGFDFRHIASTNRRNEP